MSDGNWPEEYSLFVTVKPAVYTEKEQEIRAFSGLVKQEEEAQKESQTFTLPSEYKGKSILIIYRDGLYLYSCAF
mgnify:CR=1 FL=1